MIAGGNKRKRPAKFFNEPGDNRFLIIVQLVKQYFRYAAGRPETAAQVAVSTNLIGLVAIPFWLRIGLAWMG